MTKLVARVLSGGIRGRDTTIPGSGMIQLFRRPEHPDHDGNWSYHAFGSPTKVFSLFEHPILSDTWVEVIDHEGSFFVCTASTPSDSPRS